MANDSTRVTVVGNATSDAEMRFTQGGTGVASFTVAHTDRRKVGDTWQDGDTAYYNVSAWKKLGEGVAAAVHKGSRCVVVGTLTPRPYTARDGRPGLSLDVTADEVAVSVLFAGPQQQNSGYSPSVSAGFTASGDVDPWSAGQTDEPPF